LLELQMPSGLALAVRTRPNATGIILL
jgi:hypothetical protein